MSNTETEVSGEPVVVADQPLISDVGEELAVLGDIARGLDKLDQAARGRVLDFIVARYDQRKPKIATGGSPAATRQVGANVTGESDLIDIRTFGEGKAPSTGQEMAAVLAFYLSEVAPEAERRSTITTTDVDKYFKQAGFPLPSRSRGLLFNAKTAGYLEEAGGRGEYKLSPVGYNLVKYRLPRSGENPVQGKALGRRARRSRPSTSAGADGAGLDA